MMLVAVNMLQRREGGDNWIGKRERKGCASWQRLSIVEKGEGKQTLEEAHDGESRAKSGSQFTM